MKNIELASKARIEMYESTASEFFRTVLALSYRECIVTDESRLTDFASCGLPDTLANTALSLTELWHAWEAWIEPIISWRYGVEVTSSVLLVDLFDQIEGARRRGPPESLGRGGRTTLV